MAYLEPEAYSEHCQTSTMERFAQRNSFLAHFSAQARKNKKVHPQKIICISGNGTF